MSRLTGKKDRFYSSSRIIKIEVNMKIHGLKVFMGKGIKKAVDLFC